MKHLFTLFTVIFITAALFAQNNMPENMQEEDMQTKVFAKNTKGIIQVQDSLFYSLYLNNNWELTHREKVITRDQSGNMTYGINHFWDNANQEWTNKDTLTVTYHSAEIINELYKRPWNKTTQAWADTSEFKKYDNSGNQLTIFIKGWDYNNPGFVSGNKSLRQFNTNGNIISFFSQKWNTTTNTWENYINYTYVYDANNLTIQMIHQTWDVGGSVWENTIKYKSYIYNANGDMTQRIYQVWDTGLNDWVNYRLYEYTYNTNNQRTSYTISEWDAVTSSFINWRYYTYEYHPVNGERTLALIQEWDGTGWVNLDKQTFDYDQSGNKIQYLYQNWNVASWENYKKRTYEYDDEDNLTEEILRNWNVTNTEWDNQNKWLHVYEDDNKIEYSVQNWDTGTGWADWFKYDYYWSDFETTNITNAEHSDIIIYPNPANNTLNIDLTYSSIPNSIKITDINGKTVYTGSISDNRLSIDISNYANGLYFINIETENGNIAEKFIKN